jgi:CBS domain-containing protein
MTTVQDLMTPDPVTIDAGGTVSEAARAMRDADIGDVLVLDEKGGMCGIITDRDVAIRAVAEDRDPASVSAGEICSSAVITLTPDQDVEQAIDAVRKYAVRRIPVVEGDRPVGVVSLGDLALARQPNSPLGAVSASPPNA